jgi:hypothetical protein
MQHQLNGMKANDADHCGNQPHDFIHRFYPDRFGPNDDVTPYKGEQPLYARCQFWNELDRFEDF